MVELFSYRGTFKLPLLHSIVSACQFILLDHCAHYAQSIEDFVMSCIDFRLLEFYVAVCLEAKIVVLGHIIVIESICNFCHS